MVQTGIKSRSPFLVEGHWVFRIFEIKASWNLFIYLVELRGPDTSF